MDDHAFDAALKRTRDADIDRALVEKGGLYEFMIAAWHIIEPVVEMKTNWHIGAIAEHLEAVTSGEIRKLIVNEPPGCMKSIAISIMWPAWTWLPHVTPEFKWIFASYDSDLAWAHARKQRDIVDSEWWKERWPSVTLPREKSSSVKRFENDHGGWRFSTSVRGGITGKHGDCQVVDDPIKPLDLEGGSLVTRTRLEEVISWWTRTMPSRIADPKTGRRVIVMQRLHDADLVGEMLRKMKEGTGEHYEHLCLPMEYQPKVWAETSIAPRGQDIRTEEGELLWPERFGPEEVEDLKVALGDEDTASAQLQQDPAQEGGGYFKAEWWQHWGVPGSRFETLPSESHMRFVQSWDMSFKEGAGTDNVAGVILAFTSSDVFLMPDTVYERMSFVRTVMAVEAMSKRNPRTYQKYVEDKANGPAVVNVLQNRIPGLTLVTPQGGKEARAAAVQCVFSGRNFWLPPPSLAPWVEKYKTHMQRFPKAKHDDWVDATTQALLPFAVGSRLAAYERAMGNIGKVLGK